MKSKRKSELDAYSWKILFSKIIDLISFESLFQIPQDLKRLFLILFKFSDYLEIYKTLEIFFLKKC